MPSFTVQQESATTAATLAVLPAQLLYIASQFASKDKARGGVCYVNVCKTDETITIASMDGHRLFRVRIPAADSWYLERELMLNPEAFKKRVAKADYAIITNTGTAELRDSNSGLIQSVPRSTGSDHSYPEYDRMIPDTFHCKPKAPIGLNADYLASFMKQAAAYCNRGVVKMQFNTPRTPVVFTGDADIFPGVTVTLEFLLMPVIIRD